MGCLCSTPAVEITTPHTVIAPSIHVKPSSNVFGADTRKLDAPSPLDISIVKIPDSSIRNDETTLPDSPLWEPIVPLTERAVHPLFLSAVCQLEVVLPDRGSVKLADLYTYEVVFHFIKQHTEDTQISLVETLALMLLEDEESKALMRPSSSSMPYRRPSSSSGRDSASSLTDSPISIRQSFEAKSPKEALRNILEKYVTWAGGAKPFHGPTNYFLSHAWSYKLGDLRDMCKQHYETVSGSEYKYFPIFYWIDIFAVAQNFTGDFQKHPDGNFPAVIRVSEGVVFTIHPWKNAIAPSRIWCLFEAVTAVEFGVNLELLVESEFRNTKMSKQQLLNSLQEAVSGLDVSKAKATVESDREMIIGMVKKREGGVEKFNALMQGLLQHRMLEALLLRYISTQDIQQARELIKMGAKFYRRILKFKNIRLSDQTAEIIGSALGDCLKNLDLSPSNEKGQLTEKGVRAIAAGLSKSTSLVELDLSYHQQIGEDGVHALTSALKGKNCNTSLTTLKLVKCGIDDEGAAELGELLKVNESLVKMDIGANADIKEKGAQALMTSLHGNMTLRCLDLHAVDLGHEGSWTALGLMIHANKGLEILVLNHCGLTQTAMEQVGSGLSNNKTLRLLDLSNNHLIGGKGAVALSVFLPQNSGLVELSLRDCNIDIEGGLALKEALRTNVGLVHLDIGSNLVKRKDWEEMVKHDSTIKALVSVDIPSSKPSSAAAIPWIPRVLSHGGARQEFLTSLSSSGHLLLQSPTGASKGLVGDFLPIAGSSEDVMRAMQRASILKTGLSTIAPQNQHSIFTPGSRIGLLIGSGAEGEESGSRMLQNSVSQSDWRTKSLRIASMPIIRNVDPLMSPTSATSASLLAGKSTNSSSTTATPLVSIKRLDASESTKSLNGAGKKTASASVTSEMIGATSVKGNNKGSNMVTPLPAVVGAVKSKQGLSKSAEQVVAAGVISSRVLSPSSGSKKHSLPSSKAGRVIKKISSIAEEDAAVAPTAAVVRVLPSSVKVK